MLLATSGTDHTVAHRIQKRRDAISCNFKLEAEPFTLACIWIKVIFLCAQTEKKRKLDKRAQVGFFVGFTDGNIYRVYSPKDN